MDSIRNRQKLENLFSVLINEVVKYNYVGNCVNSFDENGDCNISIFRDTSDFAVNDENKKIISKDEFLQKVGSTNMLPKNKLEFYKYPNSILVAYDSEKDVHYFFS